MAFEREMYMIKDQDGDIEFVCEACIADDDNIIDKAVDAVCDGCGYQDMEG